LEFSVSLLEDLMLSAFEFVFRGNVSDGAVKPDVVVVVDELGDQASGVIERERGFRSETAVLKGFVPALSSRAGDCSPAPSRNRTCGATASGSSTEFTSTSGGV
jgi:hypothetical protein